MPASRTLTSAIAYTDSQDSSDGHEESGPMDAQTRGQARGELRAMIETAGVQDVVIERDDDGDLTWSA